MLNNRKDNNASKRIRTLVERTRDYDAREDLRQPVFHCNPDRKDGNESKRIWAVVERTKDYDAREDLCQSVLYRNANRTDNNESKRIRAVVERTKGYDAREDLRQLVSRCDTDRKGDNDSARNWCQKLPSEGNGFHHTALLVITLKVIEEKRQWTYSFFQNRIFEKRSKSWFVRSRLLNRTGRMLEKNVEIVAFARSRWQQVLYECHEVTWSEVPVSVRRWHEEQTVQGERVSWQNDIVAFYGVAGSSRYIDTVAANRERSPHDSIVPLRWESFWKPIVEELIKHSEEIDRDFRGQAKTLSPRHAMVGLCNS